MWTEKFQKCNFLLWCSYSCTAFKDVNKKSYSPNTPWLGPLFEKKKNGPSMKSSCITASQYRNHSWGHSGLYSQKGLPVSPYTSEYPKLRNIIWHFSPAKTTVQMNKLLPIKTNSLIFTQLSSFTYTKAAFPEINPCHIGWSLLGMTCWITPVLKFLEGCGFWIHLFLPGKIIRSLRLEGD